ncbi:3-phosphoshikimate 1-carboxyvinyltransferase [Flavobacterium sediminilitoris]|uniref:3-phosphoshikimate 1-carboxyvinyltransferase n=1 Tax=Flavobacterium sediminilitoris TaxID=2024526 RepID=A0ABY4HPM0_9FLAO|nr:MULTISPECIES: 3-phosphoshikimate 1-carboxyvinyltransferase [Flavobacterium]UOX34581.1 3-phosphoshikimate 1-carboxyvinyltransferase [Flavobacterium sediminilitoris]
MNIKLNTAILDSKSRIAITGSKSETNRLLLLKALYPNIDLENISNSDDSEMMTNALSRDEKIKDIHHAGTAMRFLTAYFSIQEGKEIILTGSSRMKERPIKILVDALRQIGAEISYEENDGFPPIKIKGQRLEKSKVTLKANVSSQYISALLLIAPKLENGLELVLEGEITSVPYIKMTLELLEEIGIETSFEKNIIKVNPKTEIQKYRFVIESDWSSASYFYSIVALSKEGTSIELLSYKANSLQGDSVLVDIYKDFGVETKFINNSIVLVKKKQNPIQYVTHNLQSSPDIAQTIAVTCFGLGIKCHLTGLHTLKIKETDRLEALKTELSKLGAQISVTNDSLILEPSNNVIANCKIATYQDHRMAMAFAPLALKSSIIIEDSEVVSKSYPDFWNDLKKIGFKMEEI